MTTATCQICGGQGEVSPNPHMSTVGDEQWLRLTTCPRCGGTGETPSTPPSQGIQP